MVKFILFIVHLVLGAHFIYAQDLDSLYAVGEYSSILTHFDKHPPLSFKEKILKAKSLQAKRFDEEAIASYHLALADQEDEPRHQFAYARLLKANAYFTKADSLLTLLHSRYPKNAEFAYQLGICKAEITKNSAEIFYKKALDMDPSHQPAAYALAEFYFKIKSYEFAEHTSLTALSFNPNNKKIIGLLGQIYYRQRKLKLALEQFEKLQQLTSIPKFVIEKMAIAYANTNQLEKSIAMYKRILNMEPKNAMYHHQIAKVFALHQNFAAAEKHAELSMRLKDTSLDEERFTKALALKNQDKLEEAIKLFELVIEECPSFERAYVELALAADRRYENLDRKLHYYEIYEVQFADIGNATFKNLMYRRLTDLRREKHYASSK
ncbi:tetratricopeptide repeat protein [Psychroflexus sediminis]|uniref:Tetratricopeptide repeat-containing protein n=1 Tax=Psychroflexus sediminis TaxID=470826 RepID=A0A1G7XZD0_9FLAO|nr:hypothetical protein [Psychroflexus sediminis]SDG89534.1 Tetratricopeptide repeat-containing protein [Psychroflexus sediminis]